MRTLYLDHAATTPLDPVVLQAMFKSAASDFGNPSSAHLVGRRARTLLDEAAERVMHAIGAARSEELLFTSGGTEADNLALRGIMAYCPPDKVLVVSSAEHAAVLETAGDLEAQGRKVLRLPVDGRARLDPATLEQALLEHPVGLVSAMWANNETGSINPMPELAAICQRHGVLLHCDAVQALGRLEVRVDRVPVDLLSGSAHKFHGPKGAGFLYVKRGTRLAPVLTGGLQQEGRRGGTENVLGIVGLGIALERADAQRGEHTAALRALSREFAEGLGPLPGLRVVGDGSAPDQLPGHFSLCFEDVEGEALLLSLDMDGIAVSSGSACHTGSIEPSHVLLAAGLSRRQAKGTIRLVFGRGQGREEVAFVLDRLKEHVMRLQGTQ